MNAEFASREAAMDAVVRLCKSDSIDGHYYPNDWPATRDATLDDLYAFEKKVKEFHEMARGG